MVSSHYPCTLPGDGATAMGMKSRIFSTALLYLLLWAPQAMAFTVELTAAELQTQLAGQFPVQQITPYMTVILSDPTLVLKDNSDRIGIDLTVSATTFGNIAGNARGLVDGQLRYAPETGEFFLLNPEVHRLIVAGVPPQYQRDIQALVASVAKQALSTIPIYKLNEEDPNQSLAKSYLKSATVRDGKLVLELQLF